MQIRYGEDIWRPFQLLSACGMYAKTEDMHLLGKIEEG